MSKKFGGLQVLREIELKCPGGECVALIGPNACGKTTLIKCILGMAIPDSGRILFNGSYINSDFEYRRQIGYMPQIGRYPDNMTIGQMLDMVKHIRRHQGAMDDELFEKFKLGDLLNKPMRALSGGTIQKVSATLAFMFNPRVLILDEPTAGLDPLASELLREKIIRENQKGKLVLITSHLLSELDDLVTQIVFMQEGRVHFHKGIHELKHQTGEEKISRAIAWVLKHQIA